MNVEMKREIGLRLRQKRESAGYTREQLGELCSLGLGRLRKYSNWIFAIRSVQRRFCKG